MLCEIKNMSITVRDKYRGNKSYSDIDRQASKVSKRKSRFQYYVVYMYVKINAHDQNTHKQTKVWTTETCKD